MAAAARSPMAPPLLRPRGVPSPRALPGTALSFGNLRAPRRGTFGKAASSGGLFKAADSAAAGEPAMPPAEEEVQVVRRDGPLVILRGLTGRMKAGACLQTPFGTGVLLAAREPLGFALLSGSEGTTAAAAPRNATLLTERFRLPFAAEAAVGRVVGTLGEATSLALPRYDGTLPAPADDASETGELVSDFPDVNARQTVRQALRTGVAALDVLSPVGRGQSLLLMGPPNSGVEALACASARSPGVKTVYCATDAAACDASSDLGDIVVAPREAEPHVAERFGAILTAVALAESWRDHGAHASVVIDDFSAVPRFFEYMLAVEKEELGLRDDGSENVDMVEVDGTLMSALAAERRRFFGVLMQRAAAMSEANGGGSLALLPVLKLAEAAFLDGSPDAVRAATAGAPDGSSAAAREARELASGKARRKLPSREQVLAMNITDVQREKMLAAIDALEAEAEAANATTAADESSSYDSTFVRALAEELMSIADGQILLLPKRDAHRDGFAAAYRPDVRNTCSRLGEDAAVPALRSIGVSRVRLALMQAWDSVDMLQMSGGTEKSAASRLRIDFDRATILYRALLDPANPPPSVPKLSALVVHLLLCDALAEPSRWAEDAAAAGLIARLAEAPAAYADIAEKAIARVDAGVLERIDLSATLAPEDASACRAAVDAVLGEAL